VLGVFGFFVSEGYFSCFKNSFTFLNLLESGIFSQNFSHSSIILLWVMLNFQNDNDLLIFVYSGDEVAL
jgi:hypothetical protein